jgi:peptidoglycan hydrolase-like protein with peptidoglycan-binding domain
MTPLQARVVLGCFLLLAAGATGNALILQGAASHDSVVGKGGVGNNGVGKAKPPRAEPERGAAKQPAGAVPQAPADEADAETVRAIQRELMRLGYGPVVADGVMRMGARAAIMAFEHEHRLPLTGKATQALLKHLVFGAPVATGAAAAPEVKSPHAEAVIKQVQRLLLARGYVPGAIDGRLSAQTIAAIKAFETDQGLAAKGRISAEVVVRLDAGSADAKRHKRR